jgi:hypothetical protein
VSWVVSRHDCISPFIIFLVDMTAEATNVHSAALPYLKIVGWGGAVSLHWQKVWYTLLQNRPNSIPLINQIVIEHFDRGHAWWSDPIIDSSLIYRHYEKDRNASGFQLFYSWGLATLLFPGLPRFSIYERSLHCQWSRNEPIAFFLPITSHLPNNYWTYPGEFLDKEPLAALGHNGFWPTNWPGPVYPAVIFALKIL